MRGHSPSSTNGSADSSTGSRRRISSLLRPTTGTIRLFVAAITPANRCLSSSFIKARFETWGCVKLMRTLPLRWLIILTSRRSGPWANRFSRRWNRRHRISSKNETYARPHSHRKKARRSGAAERGNRVPHRRLQFRSGGRLSDERVGDGRFFQGNERGRDG